MSSQTVRSCMVLSVGDVKQEEFASECHGQRIAKRQSTCLGIERLRDKRGSQSIPAPASPFLHRQLQQSNLQTWPSDSVHGPLRPPHHNYSARRAASVPAKTASQGFSFSRWAPRVRCPAWSSSALLRHKFQEPRQNQ